MRLHQTRPSVEELQKQFPHATAAECRRFHAACHRDAVKKLSLYLEWRKRHELDVGIEEDEHTDAAAAPTNASTVNSDADAKDWIQAAKKAVASQQQQQRNNSSSSDTSNKPLPKKRVFGRRQRTTETDTEEHSSRDEDDDDEEEKGPRIPQLVLLPKPAAAAATTDTAVLDLWGNAVALHLPARIDMKLNSSEIYSETMALYIAQKLNRHTAETMTLLVDVRPGKDWPNPPALTTIGFIRQVSHALHDLNPHRLHRCIVYPVPLAAVYIWKMVKNFLDPNIRELVHVLSGPSDLNSEIPAAMGDFLDPKAIQAVEHARKMAMKEPAF